MCCLVHHFEIKASRVWSLRSDEGDFKYSVCVIPVNKAVKPYIHRAIDPDYYFCTPPPPPKTRTHKKYGDHNVSDYKTSRVPMI